MGYDAEYWAWCDEARERYEERIAILSDGGKSLGKWIASREWRRGAFTFTRWPNVLAAPR
jgi:hypothetical protein